MESVLAGWQRLPDCKYVTWQQVDVTVHFSGFLGHPIKKKIRIKFLNIDQTPQNIGTKVMQRFM
jgi:hypothetical protein